MRKKAEGQEGSAGPGEGPDDFHLSSGFSLLLKMQPWLSSLQASQAQLGAWGTSSPTPLLVPHIIRAQAPEQFANQSVISDQLM